MMRLLVPSAADFGNEVCSLAIARDGLFMPRRIVSQDVIR